jgi:8-oxo-dGTP pyrophosphatase MutT (NUDIX family)
MDLRSVLLRHAPADEQESADLQHIVRFVATEADPFDRRNPRAHLTASAFIVAEDGGRVLLLHHRKLKRWLQPGGHADRGESSGETVALREAREETGIRGLALHPRAPRPLDVDVHDIPARPLEPAHQHLDLRYLVVAPADAEHRPARREARVTQWFSWAELPTLDLDPGLVRGLAKARGYWP